MSEGSNTVPFVPPGATQIAPSNPSSQPPNAPEAGCPSAYTVYQVFSAQYGPPNITKVSDPGLDIQSHSTAIVGACVLLALGLLVALTGIRFSSLAILVSLVATGLGVGLNIVYNVDDFDIACALAWGIGLAGAGVAGVLGLCLLVCAPSLLGAIFGLVASALLFIEVPQIDTPPVLLERGVAFWITVPLTSLIVGALLFRKQGKLLRIVLTALLGAFGVQEGAEFAIAATAPDGSKAFSQAVNLVLLLGLFVLGCCVQFWCMVSPSPPPRAPSIRSPSYAAAGELSQQSFRRPVAPGVFQSV